MSIHYAFNHNYVADVAGALLQSGVSVIPVTGKRPAIVSWQGYQQRLASQAEAHAWFSNGGYGLAVIGGVVSHNLVIVDLDGEDAVATFRSVWPTLLDTLTMTSGSGVGQHLYYRTVKPTKPIRISGYELRSEGMYTVAPPSRHPSGRRYKVLYSLPVKVLDNLDPVRRWIQQRSQPAHIPVPRSSTPVPNGSNPRWVMAAVDRELANLRSARKGNANNVLNAVAYRLARIAANPASGLDAVTVRAQIMAAASHLTNRDGERATLATLMSGWRAGSAKPVSIPEANHGRRN